MTNNARRQGWWFLLVLVMLPAGCGQGEPPVPAVESVQARTGDPAGSQQAGGGSTDAAGSDRAAGADPIRRPAATASQRGTSGGGTSGGGTSGGGGGGFQRLYPVVEYFLVDEQGSGFDLNLEVKDLNLYPGPAELLVKVYDPQGRVVVREEVADEVTAGTYPSWVKELDYYDWGTLRGVEPMVRWSGYSDTLEGVSTRAFTYPVPAGAKGVYRVLLAGTENHFVRLTPSRPMKRGILADPNWLHGHGDQHARRFIYVPKGTHAFHLYLIEPDQPQTRRLRLLGPGGQVLVDMPPTPGGGRLIRHAMLPAEAYANREDHLADMTSQQIHFNENDHLASNYTFHAPQGSLDDQVLTLEIGPGAGDYLVSLVLDHPAVSRPFAGSNATEKSGFGPTAIYCEDEAAARAIQGGAVYWRDGTPLWHGYQVRAREYLGRFKPADFALRREDGTPLGWQSPSQFQVLYNILPWGYGRADLMLTLAERIDTLLAGLEDPGSIDEFLRKLPLNDTHLRALAVAYTQPFEGNEYFNHPAALRLLTAGLLHRFNRAVTLGDHQPPARPTGTLAYAIGYGFHSYETVVWLKDLLDEEARAILTEAMTLLADRTAFHYTVSHNAAAHFPLILRLTAQLNEDPYSDLLATRYLDRWIHAARGWVTGVTPSGDIAEYLGHSVQYAGYSWAPIARLYLNTQDPELLEVIRRGFFLHSHTSLPGIRNSPTNWDSRTAGEYQDWASAYVYLPEIVPQMALFGPAAPTPPDIMYTQPPVFAEGKEPLVSPPGITFAYVDRRDFQMPVWPAESEESFIRNINDGNAFFAVKRPEYYALVFAGRLPPVFWSDVWGGYCGLGGGNLATFYRPGKGPVIVSKKTGSAYYGESYYEWPKTRVHDVAGNMVDGREIRLGDSIPQARLEGNRLMIDGESRTSPLRYHREYVFEEDRVRVELQVSLVGAGLNRLYHNDYKPSVATLQEMIPTLLPAAAEEQRVLEAFDAEGNSLGTVGEAWIENVTRVRVGDPAVGCTLVFDQPQAVKKTLSLWVRLVDQPTGPADEIPALGYWIEVPPGEGE